MKVVQPDRYEIQWTIFSLLPTALRYDSELVLLVLTQFPIWSFNREQNSTHTLCSIWNILVELIEMSLLEEGEEDISSNSSLILSYEGTWCSILKLDQVTNAYLGYASEDDNCLTKMPFPILILTYIIHRLKLCHHKSCEPCIWSKFIWYIISIAYHTSDSNSVISGISLQFIIQILQIQ